MSDDESWIAYKRGPEASYSMAEQASRHYRRLVWKTINSPPSLRPALYALMPVYLVDRVEKRVLELERQNKKKKKMKKILTWKSE